MNISRYVKIALFFIGIGTAGTAYVVMSSDGFGSFNTQMYEIRIDDATGLSSNSKVYLAGIPIGKIKSIELQRDHAILKVAFLKDVEIRADAEVSRKTSSILGTAVLALNPGSDSAPLAKPGARINSPAAGADMNSIMTVVADLGTQLTGILAELQANQLQLLSVSLETFNSIANKIDSRTEMELDRVSRILESVAVITERTDRLLSERETDIVNSVSDIQLALENIRAITDDIRGGEGNIGQVLYDDRLYTALLGTLEETHVAAAKLTTAMDSVNRIAVDAEEVVQKAVGLGIEVDTLAGYDILNNRFRAGASLRINPRSNDRWYRVGVSSAPDGVSSRKTKETVVNGSVVSVEETTETSYKVAIDAELARQFGMFTVRGGILESTAGVGVDIQPLKWLMLSGEVFNFREDHMPNLRGSVTIYPFFDPNSDNPLHWIYLKGGINRALEDDRDFFVGAGIRFADREVKGLVGLLPSFSD
ncbi:MlaD family protein [Breznakiella homolactica]|uniref:MCE family protein n=1 Tax=Breznakiella homolactica TaxID=2798577 RepID=A0A7T8BAY5_9SPIR|nr:MlaD family protein [Breznakiella homolactica]QQO09861.1 MlaD family protein [Breznakiella homolactica]